MAEARHVVVDGSNLGTEGRTSPSLAQLDEAVRAYALEDPGADIVVVVDASFEHRIDPSEREILEQAELHGEVVSPPAGAIGRGDAFVLRIAERTGATVLSNDSFQEFHQQHPWLFDEGRLVGGKPVPGVGWIFTPRVPVRGAKSRVASKAGVEGPSVAVSEPAKAAEVAKAVDKVVKSATKRAPADEGVSTGARTSSFGRRRATPVGSLFRTAIADATAEALDPPEPGPSSTGAEIESRSKKRNRTDTKSQESNTKSQGTVTKRPAKGADKRRRHHDSSSPAPAVNDPLAFILFVAAHPIGSELEGVTASFTSHGAMVDVELEGSGSVHCYVPLSGLGDPPPTKARQVLARGESRHFVLVGLDPLRRVPELALTGSPRGRG